jgi:hypothetical protein
VEANQKERFAVRIADVKMRVGSVFAEDHSLVISVVLHAVTREEVRLCGR